MRSFGFAGLIICSLFAANATEGRGQAPPAASTERQSFSQVFVKVIVPVTSHTPMQDGPVVESWVAEELKKRGETKYFAVTHWVPVCDGLLADDVVNNNVWDGRLGGTHRYCPVGGDIPQRENGRVLVWLSGWTPGGGEVNITLPDEPGARTVEPVQFAAGKERKPVRIEGFPYVAVIVTPPPLKSDRSHGDSR